MDNSISSTMPSLCNDISSPPSWTKANGPLPVRLTNDYLFRALLQKSNNVLKGLICSLLRLSPENIHSVVITNPVKLGKTIKDKAFLLDIKISLDNYAVINLEMQVINEHNWPERSLSYLCREFDNLKSGDSYENVKPTVQIGLLDFTLFPDHPEFYATYQLLNVKNFTLYSDKLTISVLDLTRIDLAASEDKTSQIDLWASFFKAKTWEEIKMLAKKNKLINEAANTVYKLTWAEEIRLQCEAREDYYRRQRGIQNRMEQQKAAIAQNKAVIEKQNAAIGEYNATIEKNNATIEKQNITIEKQSTTIEKQNTTIEKQNARLREQDDTINSLKVTIDNLSAKNKELNSKFEKLIEWAGSNGYEP